ncbi:hypothetical protein [Chryseobacterium scophthalmum]|uniref:hypothetical protein n=1 Tax=Chryseobacterium scophthalmum TaxID=59733 RepID=UPI001AEC6BBA|nr:hypothetical protein [Chryseobacterium scophthalmum]
MGTSVTLAPAGETILAKSQKLFHGLSLQQINRKRYVKTKNKSRKSKMDLVASSIEERNIKWTYREDSGYNFIFIMDGAEIHVTPKEIKMIINNEKVDFFEDRFTKELDSLKTKIPINIEEL